MKLGYVILYVPDVAGAVAFYETAFGVARRFVHESGTYAELETGATALAFADEAMVAASHGFRRAVDAGATPLVEPTTKPWGQVVSYVRDLNGVIVEICSAVTP